MSDGISGSYTVLSAAMMPSVNRASSSSGSADGAPALDAGEASADGAAAVCRSLVFVIGHAKKPCALIKACASPSTSARVL